MTIPSKLTRIRNLIIDMDGVLYRENVPIQGAGEVLDCLRQMNTPFILLTNNSAHTAAQYVDKLANMGIEMEEDRILTSGEATAMHLAEMAPPGTRVYVIGEDGLRIELQKRGFVLHDDTDVAYVVAGFDRAFTYAKLATAALAIRAGARFIGTNPDKTFPGEAGLMPGNGAILAAIEAATDTTPLIVGKPQPTIFELALQKLGTEADTAAVVGDRLDTDILGGHHVGLATVLVLSGVTDMQQLVSSSIEPDLVYEDIAAFYHAWRDAIAMQDGIHRSGD